MSLLWNIFFGSFCYNEVTTGDDSPKQNYKTKGEIHMKINYTDKTIEMTKREEKAARQFGSEMYNRLKAARADFPKFRVIVKTTPKKKPSFKGLTYAYMEQYISTHDESGEIMEKFNILRGKVEGEKGEFAESVSYGQIKQWFLLTFPVLTEAHEEAMEILRKAA